MEIGKIFKIDLSEITNMEKAQKYASDHNHILPDLSPENLLNVRNLKNIEIAMIDESYNMIIYKKFNSTNFVMVTKAIVDFSKSMSPVLAPKEINEDLNIDSILDKISFNGIDSLSKSEKEFLKKN